MMFISTRYGAPPVSLSQAIRNGAAPDGGLYVPQTFPKPVTAASEQLSEFAAEMLKPFFQGDMLQQELQAICSEAFNFPISLVEPEPGEAGLRVLELFHGPTGAFKDFGARFLMACFDRIGDPAEPLTVLAATSGDTGGAVGCAAEGRNSVRAVILYPKGRVSAFQELQLTCWGQPVRALEVEGDFDDCQRLVKAAFARRDLADKHRLTSANSINIGRLLPQIAYLAFAASREFAETGMEPGFLIPSGNLGHGFAAVYARALGFPLGPIVLVTNANRTLFDWHASGDYRPGPSVATIANAMDVGSPSNFERLVHLPPGLRKLDVERVGDEAIGARVTAEYESSGYVWCPHSATAAEAFARLPRDRRVERPWIAAATAHPFKFADTIEPLIRHDIEAPPALKASLGKNAKKVTIPADVEALAEALGAPTLS